MNSSRTERQEKRVFKAFQSHPKTMLMVSVETGILRANICRYVAGWKRESRIGIATFGLCAISKHRAGFYTTNPDYLRSFSKHLTPVIDD